MCPGASASGRDDGAEELFDHCGGDTSALAPVGQLAADVVIVPLTGSLAQAERLVEGECLSREEILCPACVFSGISSWKKRRRGEKTSAFINYLSSFRALGKYCKIWRNACKEHSFFPFF